MDFETARPRCASAFAILSILLNNFCTPIEVKPVPVSTRKMPVGRFLRHLFRWREDDSAAFACPPLVLPKQIARRPRPSVDGERAQG